MSDNDVSLEKGLVAERRHDRRPLEIDRILLEGERIIDTRFVKLGDG
jgi:hypothetical protein